MWVSLKTFLDLSILQIYKPTGVLTVINCYNVKLVTKVTDIFTGTKIFALLIIVAAGLWYLCAGNTENWSEPMRGSQTSPGSIALAFYSGLFSYSGWNYLNFVTEELQNPYKWVFEYFFENLNLYLVFFFRNLPKAICISMPVVTIIYVVANVAYFTVLTPDELLSSEAVAVTFGGKTLGYMDWLMPFFVACSTFGSLNGAIFSSSRLFFVGARNGHLPAAISLINVHCFTPIPSLIFLVGFLCTQAILEIFEHCFFPVRHHISSTFHTEHLLSYQLCDFRWSSFHSDVNFGTAMASENPTKDRKAN